MAPPIRNNLKQGDPVEIREIGGGGSRKDFFKNDDAGYTRHKAEILFQLGEIAGNLDAMATGNIGIVKIILRRDALAKSHRPFKALFTPRLTPVVGGGDLGEIFVEARPEALRQIQAVVRNGEDQTRMKRDKTGRNIPNPSTVRRETGAIERIELFGTEDRSRFSGNELLALLKNPMSGGAYHVELFDVPPPRNQWDGVEERKRILYESFVEGIRKIGPGTVVNIWALDGPGHGRISIRLEKSSSPPEFFFEEVARSRRSKREVSPIDPDIERHKKLLFFLDDHPLVRRVELPPIITRA